MLYLVASLTKSWEILAGNVELGANIEHPSMGSKKNAIESPSSYWKKGFACCFLASGLAALIPYAILHGQSSEVQETASPSALPSSNAPSPLYYSPSPTEIPSMLPSEPPLYCFPDYGKRMRFADVWDDFTLEVKEGNFCGPKGNRFSRTNIWYDEENRELQLKFRRVQELWSASEVRLLFQNRSNFGYGTFSFSVKDIKVLDQQGDLKFDYLPRDLVLGLFTWDPTEDTSINENWNHEVDIELSRWDDPIRYEDAQFVVQPGRYSEIYKFQTGTGSSFQQAQRIYSFTWLPDKIFWQTSYQGNVTDSFIYRASEAHQRFEEDAIQCLPKNVEVRINLWNVNGASAPNSLSETDQVIVVIDKFEFSPSPQDYIFPRESCSKDCQCRSHSCQNWQCD